MRAEKQFLLDEVKQQIEQHPSFVIMKYLGLKANTIGDFRREIAGLGGDVEMVRKTILVKAAQAAGIELDIGELPGHIGIVFAGKDAIQTTKAVYKLSESSEKAVEVLGGNFEGQFYGAEDVEKLSKLPDRDTMRAQLLSVFEAPMAQTLAVMDSLLSSVVYCLENKSKQQEPAQ
jgi:large subunit ribosomal protein L10